MSKLEFEKKSEQTQWKIVTIVGFVLLALIIIIL